MQLESVLCIYTFSSFEKDALKLLAFMAKNPQLNITIVLPNKEMYLMKKEQEALKKEDSKDLLEEESSTEYWVQEPSPMLWYEYFDVVVLSHILDSKLKRLIRRKAAGKQHKAQSDNETENMKPDGRRPYVSAPSSRQHTTDSFRESSLVLSSSSFEFDVGADDKKYEEWMNSFAGVTEFFATYANVRVLESDDHDVLEFALQEEANQEYQVIIILP